MFNRKNGSPTSPKDKTWSLLGAFMLWLPFSGRSVSFHLKEAHLQHSFPLMLKHAVKCVAAYDIAV
jgi:hypothetical protein